MNIESKSDRVRLISANKAAYPKAARRYIWHARTMGIQFAEMLAANGGLDIMSVQPVKLWRRAVRSVISFPARLLMRCATCLTDLADRIGD